MPPCAFVKNTIPHAITTTTTVLMAVARFEFTPSMPIFANMEVAAANTADSNANINHMNSLLYSFPLIPIIHEISCKYNQRARILIFIFEQSAVLLPSAILSPQMHFLVSWRRYVTPPPPRYVFRHIRFPVFPSFYVD